MTTYPEIEGMEFDWFAADRMGNIALFATAGTGYVPSSVFANREMHQEIIDGIEAPHWGSEQVWNDYAMLGLFVYDWVLHNGPYRQIRAPTCGMTEQLMQKLKTLPSLPQLDLEFSNSKDISVGILSDAI